MAARILRRLVCVFTVVILSGCGDRDALNKANADKAAAEKLAEEQRAAVAKATAEIAKLEAHANENDLEPLAYLETWRDAHGWATEHLSPTDAEVLEPEPKAYIEKMLARNAASKGKSRSLSS